MPTSLPRAFLGALVTAAFAALLQGPTAALAGPVRAPHRASSSVVFGSGTLQVDDSGLWNPVAIVENDGALYVAEAGKRQVSKLVPGDASVTAVATGFDSLTALVVQRSTGDLYAAQLNEILLRDGPLGSGATFDSWAGSSSTAGTVAGSGGDARFDVIVTLLLDTGNVNMYVATAGGTMIHRGDLATATFSNFLLAAAGGGPKGMTIKHDDTKLWFYGGFRIRSVTTTGTQTVATRVGTGTAGSVDGASGTATLNHAYALLIDLTDQYVYFADTGTSTVRLADVTTGTVSTVWGNGNTDSASFGGSGTPLNVAIGTALRGLAMSVDGTSMYVCGEHSVPKLAWPTVSLSTTRTVAISVSPSAETVTPSRFTYTLSDSDEGTQTRSIGTPTLSLSPSVTATITATISPARTPTKSPSFSDSESVSRSMSPGPTHTLGPTSTRTSSASPSKTFTPSTTQSASPSASRSRSSSLSRSQSLSLSPTPSCTTSQSHTLTRTISVSRSVPPTRTPTYTRTVEVTVTVSENVTDSETLVLTPSDSPSDSLTYSIKPFVLDRDDPRRFEALLTDVSAAPRHPFVAAEFVAVMLALLFGFSPV
jgi:hypothetical protein